MLRTLFHKRLFITGIFLGLMAMVYFTREKFEDNRGNETQFISDVNNYYSYLPAAFIHHDLSFGFPNDYWFTRAPNGNNIPKGTMGMAVMYSPFFWLGHMWAKATDHPVDGYSPPYTKAIRFGTFVYLFLGLLALYHALRRFYNDYVIGITLCALFIGTNLWYYTVGWGEMPHCYVFSLYCFIIYLTIRWHEAHKAHHFFLLSFLIGLCALIRPTAVVIILFPLLYGVTNWKTFKEKADLIWSHKIQLLVGLFLFFIPLIPQMLYWKAFAGSYLFFSYGSEENFFFNNPHIAAFLFGFRKGLFIYTPMIIFGFTGLFLLYKYAPKVKLVVPVIVLLMIYVLSSWWAWWYGGSFGMRSMIQFFALLAFPFAAFVAWVAKKWYTLVPVLGIMTFFVYLNLFQSLQYKGSQIHWDGMTKEAYRMIFLKDGMQKEDWDKLEKLIDPPDYEAAKRGEDA